jgi:hypothetical protein
VAWSDDERCLVSQGTLSSRLAQGMSPEEAICRPPQLSEPRWIEAFGEVKTYSEWASDPRCLVTKETLRRRIHQGQNPEQAMRPKLTQAVARKDLTCRVHKGYVYEAFGERKTLRAWSQDSRCEVSLGTLRGRMRYVDVFEEALYGRLPVKHRLREAFGERKTLSQWEADERCLVSGSTVRKRLSEGEDLESALTRPPSSFVYFENEWKSVRSWSQDERCEVSYPTLRSRLKKGLSLPEAFQKKVPRSNSTSKKYEAFGLKLTLSQWQEDPRVVVSVSIFHGRLKKGWDIHRALTTPSKGDVPVMTAFGVRKSLLLWFQDERCKTTYPTLEERFFRGWDTEKAITTPGPKLTQDVATPG